MTNPVRLFAMLTDQVPPWSETGVSSGKPEVDQAYAAALCAGMPEKWFKAGRLKWANDTSGNGYLRIRLWMAAADLATAEKWRIPTGREYLRKMAEMAILELSNPAILSQPGAWRWKCDYIGCGQAQYFTTWGPRYEAIYQILDSWADRGYGHLVNRQKEII